MVQLENTEQFGYVVKPIGFLDYEDYYEINTQLRRLYLFWNKEAKGWKVPKGKEGEVALYLEKKLNIPSLSKVEFTENVEPETEFNRSYVFKEDSLKVTLYDYQKEDVNWALKRTRGFIASDPGVGKTIESISIISQLKRDGKIDGVFLLVKNNLTYHWKREIEEFSSVFSEQDIFIVTNKNKKKVFRQGETPPIVICPNHILKDVLNEDINLKESWKKENLCLLIDESHEFKNSLAKRTISLFKILKDFKYRYELSATPAINGFEDWYSQMRILDPSIIPLSEKAFKMEIARVIGTEYDPYKIISYNQSKVKSYLEKFKPWVVKRIKTDLPEMKTKQVVKPIYLELSDKQHTIYDMVRNLYIKKAVKDEDKKVTYADIVNKFPYLIMAIDNPSLLKTRIKEEDDPNFDFKPLEMLLKNWDIDKQSKTDYLDDFLLNKIKNEKEKVIVFDTHPITLDELEERYKEYYPLVIHGQKGQSLEQRQKIIDDFNDPKSKHKLILLNAQTGGTGLNLHKACNTIIYYNLPYDTTLYRQSLDRTYRISSTRDSFVEILCYGKSFDERRLKESMKRTQINDYSFKEEINDLLEYL
jgi:hypothetical protein